MLNPQKVIVSKSYLKVHAVCVVFVRIHLRCKGKTNILNILYTVVPLIRLIDKTVKIPREKMK